MHVHTGWLSQQLAGTLLAFVELDSAISSTIFPFTTSNLVLFSALPHIDKQLLFCSYRRRDSHPTTAQTRATVLASALVPPSAFVIPLSSYPPPCSEQRRLGRSTKSSVSILRTGRRSIAKEAERCFSSSSLISFSLIRLLTPTTAKATDENLTSEDWGAIIEVCDKVSGDQNGAKEAVQSMIKRLAHRNANVQLYTLEVCPSFGPLTMAALPRSPRPAANS